MTRLIQQHPPLAARSLSRLAFAVLVALLLAASTADAALTTSACLVQKRKAWIIFRKCQGTAQVKQLKGKPADLAKCQTTFQNALTKIDDKATKAGIACRYRDNGDGTVTDYDTGLMWEQKTVGFGGICFFVPLGEISHCVNDTFTWADAQSFVNSLNGSTADGRILANVFAGHADWRLPTIVELRTILLEPYPCATSPCIDSIFGPTANNYWSATTSASHPQNAWVINPLDGFVGGISDKVLVRVAALAVRTGL